MKMADITLPKLNMGSMKGMSWLWIIAGLLVIWFLWRWFSGNNTANQPAFLGPPQRGPGPSFIPGGQDRQPCGIMTA